MTLGRGWLVVVAVALPWPLCALAASGEAPSDGGARLELEAFESLDSFEAVGESAVAFEAPAPMAPTALAVRVFGHVSGSGAVDTRFESPRGAALAENVGEARLRAAVGLDAKFSERVRVVVEGRGQVRLTTQRDFDRLKGFFEPMVGDAYLDVYSSWADVRVGNQRVPLGANAALAPADALNPRDLRESVMSGDADDLVLPVFAVRVQGEVKHFAWLVAYAPFFAPHRYAVFGQDEALLQPALGTWLDDRRVDPSLSDPLQERLLETRLPPPFLGDVAVRVVRQGPVKVGASWVWLNEKMPRLTVDPQLVSLLSGGGAGGAGNAPADGAAAAVWSRIQAGETLFRGSHARSHLFSLEASTLVGPGQLDVDVTYTPRATYVDPALRPVDRASVTWVVGYSQSSESPIVYSLSYLGMAVPEVAAGQQLLFLEPAAAAVRARTVVFHLVSGSVAVPLWRRRFEVAVRASVEPVQGSIALGPRVSFLGVDGLAVWAAAEVYEGPAMSPFGYFARNNKVLVGARFEL
jgi:hypothetical protein